jgi:hypothetical protein
MKKKLFYVLIFPIFIYLLVYFSEFKNIEIYNSPNINLTIHKDKNSFLNKFSKGRNQKPSKKSHTSYKIKNKPYFIKYGLFLCSTNNILDI